MDVSIIIINYNTLQLTSNCIQSVIEHTKNVSYEIILVDNASSECDPEIFIQRFPAIRLVKSTVNGGFAHGNNLGIATATGEYILLLNSDTILKEDSVSSTFSYAKQNAKAGVVGCRMTYPDNTIQYTARRFRTISWELLDLFRFIPMMMPYEKRALLMLGKYFSHDENMECDWVNGAFFMFPKTILNVLPNHKLDERFFMYGEDHLWCEQIRENGYKVLFYAGTTIIHINSGSTDKRKQLSLRKTMMKHELEIVCLRKGKSFYYYLFSAIYTSKEMIRNTIKSIVFRFTGKLVR